jgi:hypothetical protein
MHATAPSQFQFDLLKPRLVQRLLRRPWFPLALQFVSLGFCWWSANLRRQ